MNKKDYKVLIEAQYASKKSQSLIEVSGLSQQFAMRDALIEARRTHPSALTLKVIYVHESGKQTMIGG